MQKILFSILTLLVSLSGLSQIKTDSVYVSTTQTAYLVFPEQVDLVDIGNHSQYISTVDGKTVFLKAKSTDASPTKYLVKCADNYYEGVLLFSIKPARSFYDYRNLETTIVTTTTIKAKVKEDSPEKEPLDTFRLELKQDLASFKAAASNKYKTIGAIADNQIYCGLSDLRHNRKGSFIKIKVSNLSSIPYLVDHVIFEIYQDKSVLRNEIKIIIEDVPRQVAGKEDGYLYFALPLLSIPENCELKITLRERGGLRTVILFVPSKIIAGASTF